MSDNETMMHYLQGKPALEEGRIWLYAIQARGLQVHKQANGSIGLSVVDGERTLLYLELDEPARQHLIHMLS